MAQSVVSVPALPLPPFHTPDWQDRLWLITAVGNTGLASTHRHCELRVSVITCRATASTR
uniref:Uncharacterized protein n=1 Tax=Pseudomonas aeruginosa TaxID=287 RepID=A0A6H1Q8A6_PSEAI|nr:Hypothetical protein [Pseudomonas aeruginosa]